jgi:GTP-binding protein Era
MNKDTFKSGFATLIGRPNVGKSTLMNLLIGQKIAITSCKPQTTRNRIQTVYTDDDRQIVFLDTPGIHKPKNKLGEYMLNASVRTLKEADVILWLIEPTTYMGAGEQHIAELIKEINTPIILVINKIDTVKKDDLLEVMDKYKDVCDFAEIIPVSAFKGTNKDVMLENISKYLPYGPMLYDEDTVTDQPMRQIASEVIREKALQVLEDEIPHGIAVTIEKMKNRKNNLVDIEANIVCERDSHKGIIIGKGGVMLKRIGINARYELEHMLESKVNLQLWVKVRKEWRDNELYMKNYGYNKDL